MDVAPISPSPSPLRIAGLALATAAALAAAMIAVRVSLGHRRVRPLPAVARALDRTTPPRWAIDPPRARRLPVAQLHYYRIARSAIDVDRLFSNPGDPRSVRIVPSLTDGRPSGFKLYAIRPGGFVWQLGLRNGDTVRRINGVDVNEPERCLGAYVRLRGASLVVVELERRGALHLLYYRVVS